jgi:hypothetical protein
MQIVEVFAVATEVEEGLNCLGSRVAHRSRDFFRLLAQTLVAVGLYGLLAFTVAQRTSEVGIRMALERGQRRLCGMMLAQSIRPAAGKF